MKGDIVMGLAVKPKDLIDALCKNGFVIVRIKGSHYRVRKGDKAVTIPFHNKELKPGTLQAILKSLGITKEELARMLKDEN